jgi:aspartate/methionine/tyrosine aminotransferase
MYPAPFALERFFARHEFSARYLLSASDCQGPSMANLVAGAEPDLRRRWDTLTLGYTESQGLPELREAIAGMYGQVGAEQVLVAAPEELIFLAMHALLSPGDHVVCTFPGYQSLYELARSIGCEVELWRPEETGAGAAGGAATGGTAAAAGAMGAVSSAAGAATAGWRFDPAGLQALLRPTTKLVVWNFPHNPTGALPSAADFTRMLESVAGVGAWLFSDEMYRLLEPGPELRLPPAVDLYDRAVSLAGMSKAFGLAGLRIGWVAARDQGLLERMTALKDYTTICSSAPSELLALMALRSAEPILAANRARVERNTRTAAEFFARHRETFSWIPPRAGTVCFPRLLSRGARGAAGGAEAFCAAVLKETGALLLPSTVYGYGDAHFRLGLGRDDFGAGLEVLEGFLAAGRGAA